MSQNPFSDPIKRIQGEADLVFFHRSVALKKLHHAMAFLVDRVKATEVPPHHLQAEIVSKNHAKNNGIDTEEHKNYESEGMVSVVIGILDSCGKLIDETPPLPGPRRFGNMACRDWHSKVATHSLSFLKPLHQREDLLNALNHYFTNSFGSESRLDYGSGHELSFVAFIGGLLEQGILDKDISGQDILAIFSKYYDLVRRLIIDYSLEPAGSHGVWGLDDHFHFIYILGAAEFNTPSTVSGETRFNYVPPVLSILTSQTINTYKTSNLYVNAIAFIFKLKLGPFNEHSPVLNDIHKSVTLWSKVLSGLLKMYEVEVFGKYPVIQHFWFGEGLYPWRDATTLKLLPVQPTDTDKTPQSQSGGELSGLINGLQGTRTTNNNIAMTGAPWARQSALRGVPPRGTWGTFRDADSKKPQSARDRP